jgi:hypothetical protein
MSRQLYGYASIQDVPDLNLQLRVTILAIVVAGLGPTHPRRAEWDADLTEAANEFIRRGCPTGDRPLAHAIADDDGMPPNI